MWELLSNSWDILKFLRLNLNQKIMNGWTNYSCIVTSQNISSPFRMKMDNHGSKLEYCTFILNLTENKYITEKEQRVNDSRYKNTSYLRCTLLDFERNYQFKIPFKLINKSRFYTSKAIQKSDININILNAYFVTGFSDAESSFVVRILKNSKYNTGLVVSASFQISLQKKILIH
uniref:Homing endonuclease LAGLIDADG domain-containing protein n=1 Tax=Dactylella tenuis TaxID=383872 RepID=A0A4Y5MZP4_9PEZI|nr:hypothetical protein [Dactylella tenuis]QCW06829.1 hypothetical protein [Dactylella tenuis]